jgi:hypothetical protein
MRHSCASRLLGGRLGSLKGGEALTMCGALWFQERVVTGREAACPPELVPRRRGPCREPCGSQAISGVPPCEAAQPAANGSWRGLLPRGCFNPHLLPLHGLPQPPTANVPTQKCLCGHIRRSQQLASPSFLQASRGLPRCASHAAGPPRAAAPAHAPCCRWRWATTRPRPRSCGNWTRLARPSPSVAAARQVCRGSDSNFV